MTVATIIYRKVCTRNECIGRSCPTVLIRCSLVRRRPRFEECRPSVEACTQRIRRKLVQSNAWTLHCKRYIKDNDFINQFTLCECEFPSSSSAAHEPLFQVACVRLYWMGVSWKEDCDPSVKRSNRLLFSWRLNVTTCTKSDSLNFTPRIESYFVENVTWMQYWRDNFGVRNRWITLTITKRWLESKNGRLQKSLNDKIKLSNQIVSYILTRQGNSHMGKLSMQYTFNCYTSTTWTWYMQRTYLFFISG